MKAVLVSMMAGLAALGSAPGGTKNVNVEEAAELIAGEVQVVDVRTVEEWDEGHLDGAVRIDVRADDFSRQIEAKLEKDRPILVYCRSGGRSAGATAKMEALGFTELYNLKGGILAWEKAGKPVSD